MNKLVGYTVLVLGTLGFLLIYGLVSDTVRDIAYEGSGLQFISIGKGDAIKSDHTEPFTIKYYTNQKGDNLNFYMTNGHTFEGYTLYVYEEASSEDNVYTLAEKAIKDEIQFTDTLTNLSRDEFFELLTSMNNFKGAKLNKYNYVDGWFGFLDDTVIIFVIFGLIFFVICLILNSFFAYLNKKFGGYIEWVLLGLLFICLSYLIKVINFSMWYPYDSMLNDYRSIASVLLPFILFRYVKQKTLQLEFSDREVIKFFTIIIGTFVIGYILSRITFSIDSSNFNNILMMENHGPFKITMGMAVSIAGGNMLANLVRHMISVRGSEKILKKSVSDLGKSSAELHALQSNINPHFLYNALNSIASTAKKDGDKTERMALALSQFYNYVTNKGGEEVTILLAEEEMLDNYLQIEKIRFGDKLNIEYEINDNAHQCYLPRLLLQPIVENAIKYGFGENKIEVKISAEKKNQYLEIKIYDSGPAFDENMQMGFGIKSVTRKLQALYPDQHSLEFNNSPVKHVLITIDQKS
jgi:sensor histidine kinase YesM